MRNETKALFLYFAEDFEVLEKLNINNCKKLIYKIIAHAEVTFLHYSKVSIMKLGKPSMAILLTHNKNYYGKLPMDK